MFKFALAAGIVAEWLTGPPVASVIDLAYALLRGFLWLLVAWMVLETCRAVYKTVMSYDGHAQPPSRGNP